MEINNTKVHVFQPSAPFVYIIITPSTESVTYLFTVDLFSGGIFFTSTPYVDIFKSHRQACNFIIQKYNKPLFRLKQWQGKGLIGVTIENKYLIIGLVESAPKCATLPNGSIINQINSVKFITIPLKTSRTQNKPSFESFPIEKKHIYCENYDITRPYPSSHSVNDYDESFCWNQRWRIPFIRFGVEFVCIVLIQGFARTSQDSSITYIVRRSVLNPYTRYTSRGINEHGSPGNEAECELIFAKCGDKNGAFASNCWRRGSIPMVWKTQVGVVGAGQHIISQEQGDVTSLYFHEISDRFDNIPITVISLLNESESMLNDAYKNAVDPLDFVSFLLFNILAVPEKMRIEQFKLFMSPLVDSEKCFTIGDKNGVYKRQQILFRFNCVDSTDRTNLATYVYGRILTGLKTDFISLDEKDLNLFLGPAFIDAGNVISILYTSTEAALTKLIRDTTDNTRKNLKDSPITVACKRRIKHIYGDDTDSDKVIESWTSKVLSHYNPVFSIDSIYLSLVQDSLMTLKMANPVDPSVISFEYTSTKVDSINGEFEVLIELPMPLMISVIRIMFLPNCFGDIPKSFTLMLGMDHNNRKVYLKDVMIPDVKEPTLVKYSLYHSYRWGIQAPLEQEASLPTRFVWILFKQGSKNVPVSTSSMGFLRFNIDANSGEKSPSNHQIKSFDHPNFGMNHKDKSCRFSSNNVSPVKSNPKIAIGNILIDAYIPSTVTKLPTFNNEDSIVVNEYKQRIDGVLNECQSKNMSLESLMKLELFRIKNKIPLHVRNIFMIEKGINPIVTSIRYYIHRRADPSVCYFCHESLKDSLNTIENELFTFHEQFRSILIPAKKFQFNHFSFPLCKKCREQIAKCSNELSEIDSMIAKVDPPEFSLRRWKQSEIKEQVCLSKRPLATFLEFPDSKDANDDINDLLFSDDDEEEIEEESDESKKVDNFNLKKIEKKNNRKSLCTNINIRKRPQNSRISGSSSCITSSVIHPKDKISSVDIDINDDTFTYISNQADDAVIKKMLNENDSDKERVKPDKETVLNENEYSSNNEENSSLSSNLEDMNFLMNGNDSSSNNSNGNNNSDNYNDQLIKKVESVSCNMSSFEDKSKIKYVIDSSETKVFVFTLCLSSFCVPNELIITFEGSLPEKVDVAAIRRSNKANVPVIPRSISTVSDAYPSPLISPLSSEAPSFKSEYSEISSSSSTSFSSPSSPKISHQNLPVPKTSVSISELNPRRHSSYLVKHDDKIYVQFDPFYTSSLTFIVYASESQNEIIMKHVKVNGNFAEKPAPKPSWYTFPVSLFNGNKMMGIWDLEKQTHTFSFKSQFVLRRVNFKVPFNTASATAASNNTSAATSNAGSIIPNKSCGNISGLAAGHCIGHDQMPQSIILAMYDNRNTLVKYFHILIPQLQPPPEASNSKELEMNFQISDSPHFTTIRLFYLDAIEKIKPFEVSFLTSYTGSDKK